MEVKDLHTVDTKLKLLAGIPIEISEVGLLKPFTMLEIAELGYSVYAQRLQTLTMDVKKALGNRPELENVELTAFDLYTHMSDDDFKTSFVTALKYFLREDKLFHTFIIAETGDKIDVVLLGVDNLEDVNPDVTQRIIHRENFKVIVEALKLQNGLSQIQFSKEYNPQEERAKKLAEKLKKTREKVKEIKKNQGGSDDEIDIADIVSAVAGQSNSIGTTTIWGLTLYQLYDHFKRLEIISQYIVNIQAIMNGAEEIDLKHWSGRLDKND